MSDTVESVTPDAVRTAAARIAGGVQRTPCLHAATFSQRLGAEIHLKFENLQFTASFKERGALNRLLTLTPEERARGVVAMSAGNHAQGLAYHAARLGIRADIVMPRGTPYNKVTRTQVHGAHVHLVGDNLAQAYAEAQRLEAAGRVLVHPYDDPAVVAGQGTVALEMLEALPTLDALVVPIGGGGLIAGMAVIAKAMRPALRIYGVETRGWCAMRQRLAGETVNVGGDTVAEGLAVRDVGELPLALCRDRVDEVLLVGEGDVETAICWLAEIEKTVAEGAGAAGLAALIRHRERFAGLRVGVPISGGNIDLRVLSDALLRGLARDGRLSRIAVSVSDIAGSLARVTGAIGAAGGNIIDVAHERVFTRGTIRESDVRVVVETRDAAHARALVATLIEQGHRVRVVDADTGE
jgi:threonine dehydratase